MASSTLPSTSHIASPDPLVFCSLEQHLFTSPTCDNFPENAFSKKPVLLSDRTRFQEFLDPTWFDPAHPYLAFLPATGNVYGLFLGPIFSRLNVRPGDLVIVPTREGFYQLDASKMVPWQRLETALVWLLRLLGQFALGDPNQNFDKFSYYPSTMGYLQAHSTKKAAFSCAIRSRDAFVFLTTYVSYAVARCSKTSLDLRTSTSPSWVNYIRRNHKNFDEGWISDLRDSFVCNFSFGFRVGCILQRQHAKYEKDFTAMKLCGIPMWIDWGSIQNYDTYAPPELFRAHFPNKTSAWEAYQRSGESGKGIATRTARDGMVPPSFPGSGQYAGELPSDFMLTLDKHDHELAMAASTEEMQDARQRERLESTRLANDKAHFTTFRDYVPKFFPSDDSQVFEWVTCGPWVLRKPLHGDDRLLRWRSYSPAQKIYHPYFDSWDMSVDFTPHLPRPSQRFIPQQATDPMQALSPAAAPQQDDYSNEDPVGTLGPDITLPAISFSYDDDLSDSDDSDDDAPIFKQLKQSVPDIADVSGVVPPAPVAVVTKANDHITLDPFLKALQIHYGFYPVYLAGENPPRLVKILASLAGKSEQGSLQSTAIPSIAAFHQCLLADGPIVVPTLCDLHRAHIHHLTITSERFKVTTIHRPSGEDLFIVSPANISKPIHEQWYVLGFEDPATVLLLHRVDWATGILAIVRGLVARGIQFYTIRFRKYGSEPEPAKYHIEGLGVRPANYTFTPSDYERYERYCEPVFSGASGRAALLEGGIVWRRAIEYVNPKHATAGPSSTVTQDGRLLFVDRQRGLGAFHDHFSGRAKAVVSGITSVPTGQGADHIVFYWWPPPDIFKKSGMWPGYWSLDAEKWYQKCLNSYRDGTGQPRRATQWAHALRQEQTWMGKIASRNTEIANIVLSGGTLTYQ